MTNEGSTSLRYLSFFGGNVADSFNVSMNGAWYNEMATEICQLGNVRDTPASFTIIGTGFVGWMMGGSAVTAGIGCIVGECAMGFVVRVTGLLLLAQISGKI